MKSPALAFLGLTALLSALLTAGCENPAAWEPDATASPDSLINYYRTPHFVFLYDTAVYRREEVIANGKVKEAHLKRITGELEVSFDKEIVVRLVSDLGETWAGLAHPTEPYFIEETRSYFLSDNGHEVAHIVSFEALGKAARYRFFVEGLAAAHELDDRPKWARLCNASFRWISIPVVLDEMTLAQRSESVDYALAAAYVEWLETEFGMERFKDFYRDLQVYMESSYASLVLRHFDVEPGELHRRFDEEVAGPAERSKYCAY